jgi:hypothetical protein
MASPPVGTFGEGVAKGDLLIIDNNLDVERIPVGADDEFLVADASTPTGVVWRKLQPGDHTVKYYWFGITSNAETNDGSYATVEVGQNASINLTFNFPDDFGTLPVIEVICIPNDTEVDKNIELFSNYAAVGEDKAANAQSDIAQLFSFTADEIFAIDVTSLFTSAVGGDMAGIMLDHIGINTSIRYLGMRFQYKPA